MLYDPKWEVKADPFSFESFIVWLEKQPPERRYLTLPFNTCILATFAIAMGAKDAFDASYRLGNEKPFASVAFARDGDVSYGGALRRARALAR